MLDDLSYRYKIPLAMSLVIVATAAVATITFTWQGYRQAYANFLRHGEALGLTLARTVRPALLHDDVWQAYEILRTPLDRPGDDSRVLILLDARGHVFAASNPRQFAVLTPFPAEPDTKAALFGRTGGNRPRVVESRDGRWLIFSTPVLAEDDTVLGHLVQRYDRRLLTPRFTEVIADASYAAAAALLLLLPLAWLAGKRLTEPLSQLAECLGRVGRELPETIHCDFHHGRDEIGRLAQSFEDMVGQLREKQALERHLAQSDRLAAIGRLSAGIAHEINNPLGGMLNAISNYRRRGSADPQAEKTLGLIERGLTQIRDTVSALLVESRLESRALTPADLEDARTLVAVQVQSKRLRLDWRNEVTEPLPLPSAQVRQILLNLLLNAVQASPEASAVQCAMTVDTALTLTVANAGPAIPERRRQHLFEPYFGTEGGEGHGLGLWVTYQLVNQMHGSISVESVPGHTRFTVILPLLGPHET